MPTHNINIPDTATKQLAIQSCSAGRKLTVSTNWLILFGFVQGAEVVEELIGEGKGIIVRLANSSDTKKKKVYTRTYTSRRNNPLETQLDIRSQSLLDRAIPAETKNVHITFSHGKVTIRPITSRQAKRIHLAKSASNLLSAFVACSSGVDATGLYNEGFRIDAALEWRPNERRDNRDLSETGALNFISNVPVKHLINEDIGEVNVDAVAQLVSASKTSLLSISLQCDEFSNVKAKSLKERSLEDLSTSSDMVYDALKIIEMSNFPFVLLEQVSGFMTSEAYAILETKLRKWGYSVHKSVMDARDYTGNTSRKRFFMFATSFDTPFAWPELSERRTAPIWDEFIAPALPRLRDVTHSKSIQDGAACGRLRVINSESTCSPTFLKSQDRMAKDSVVVEHEGRYYFPDVQLMQDLMSIPSSFSTDAVSLSQASEIIGQSIDFANHSLILHSVKRHVELVAASLHGRKQLSMALSA
ncbi:MAG: DNA cytosine methyltransferase [Sulfurimonas sp.]|jgi:DNA (cytosine-5)-methyltransferase 1